MKSNTDKKVLIKYIFIYIGLTFIVSYLFYDSFIAFCIISLFCPVYLLKKKKQFINSMKEKMKCQFCDMIESVETSLSASMSVENAFINSRSDMEKLHGKDSVIIYEIDEIIKKLEVNIPLGLCLDDLSKRTHIEDISDFTTVFNESIKSGGNQVEIIKNTISIMQEKKRIEEEIQAMLKGKMLEHKVVSIVPFLIFLYLRIFNGDYLDILYHNLAGIIVMSICLIIYVVSFYISERIVSIRV